MWKRIALIVLAVAGFAFSAYSIAKGPELLKNSERGLKVFFLDVGQGDAALIATPGGKHVLVDGGEGDRVLRPLGEALPFKDRTIDLMILTHPHADHMEGLIEVLRRYKIKEVWYTGAPHTTDAFVTWLEEIKEHNIPLKHINGRERITLESDVTFDILYPDHDVRGLEGVPAGDKANETDSLNNTSIVFRLKYGDTSFLFTGDAEAPVEEALLASDMPLAADVLKVSHHGSQSGTTFEFLRVVNPKIALIGVGKDNRFGHPHRRVLRRIARVGAKIYRTDVHGTVTLISDGQGVRVETER